MISAAFLALIAASLVLQGAAIWLQVLSVREARAGRQRQAERDASMLAAFERALRVEPGTIAQDIQSLQAGEQPTRRIPKTQPPAIDIEAERRAENEWRIHNGYAPKVFAPASVARDTKGKLDESTTLPANPVEIR
jgi:hypothetical protein